MIVKRLFCVKLFFDILTNSTGQRILCSTSSYFGYNAARISSSDGLIGNSVQVRSDPVTVIASEPHDVTEASPWEGAVSDEHKSGDLLIL